MKQDDVFQNMSSALSSNIETVENLHKISEKSSPADLKKAINDIQASLENTLELFRFKEYVMERTLEKWLQLKQDLSLARDVQKTIFPKENIYLSGFQLAGYTRAAMSVGGDYYTYNITNTGIHAAIGDISGKGVANALLIIMLDSFYKNLLLHQEMALEGILTELNQFFNDILSHYETLEKKFMTFITFRFMEKIEYAGAGHEYILVYRVDTKQCERIKTGGVALGLLPDSCAFSQGQVELKPGESLVTYSDGITEARNDKLRLYGQDRLIRTIETYHKFDPEKLINKIIEDVDGFQGEHDQYDDITLLVMKCPEL